jgi:hypothetical protein
MRLWNESTTEQLRASTSPRYVKPQALDQLEQWMKENPIPYISNEMKKKPWLLGEMSENRFPDARGREEG